MKSERENDRTRSCLAAGLAVLLAISVVQAAEPPELINYQGVLRDSSDQPLTGDYAMVFRLFDGGSGSEILVDIHDAASSNSVTVTNGLFNVQVGSGAVADGAGPGTYTSLSEVFRDYADVLLQVEINGETLSPEVRVVSSAYAHNASHFAGLRPDQYLRSDMDNLAHGKNWFAGMPVGSSTGGGSVLISPPSANPDDTLLGIGVGGAQRLRVDAEGDTFLTGELSLGANYTRLPHGGYLWDSGNHVEIRAGDADTDDLTLTAGNSGTDGSITIVGDGLMQFRAGNGDFSFLNGNTSIQTAFLTNWGELRIGGNLKVGDYATNNNDYIYFDSTEFLAWSESKNEFQFSDELEVQGGLNVLKGTSSYGSVQGGDFNDLEDSGRARVAYGDLGIQGEGDVAGGYFLDSDGTGQAYLAKDHAGISAAGNDYGGFFEDIDDSGYAFVGYFDTGVSGYGTGQGGRFEETSQGTWAVLSTYGQSIWGNGTKNFVQNHPYDKGRVVTYTALEGDEVGTYTRGIGRLVGGEARVTLGETFAWVTNPDVGLTAHLTPRGNCAGLYVESISTTEMIVRESGGGSSDVVFDYIVHGLRIGFEEFSSIREKEQEARIPSMAADLERYEREPGLRDYTGLARFRAMSAEAGVPLRESSRAALLLAAIERHDPLIHSPTTPRPGHAPSKGHPRSAPDVAAAPEQADLPGAARRERRHHVAEVRSPDSHTRRQEIVRTPVSEPVEPGDVLVLDADLPGALRRSAVTGDAAVAAIASGPAESRSESDPALDAPVVFSGITSCKVDAGYGAVRVGDLLTTSPTEGHAMLAVDPLPGTILGKAVEPLDVGTGKIRVLVTLR